MNNIIWIILGMMVVTYVPRLIPFYLVGGKSLPRKIKAFLEYVPYAALGALIFPGALTAMPHEGLAAMGGLVFAGLHSYFRGGMIVSVVGGILITYGILLWV